MSTRTLRRVGAACALALAMAAAPAQAALLRHGFTVTIDSTGSALAGQSFSGHFSYDDASPSGTGLGGEDLFALTAFDFRFAGTTYGLADLGWGDAAVEPGSGRLLGLDAGQALFAFLPEIAPFAASFAYDDGQGDAGTGDFRAQRIPAPPSLALALLGLALVIRNMRRYGAPMNR